MGALNVGVFRLYRSSIGKKVIMAVTGAVWVGYVIMHMYGNTKAFGGAEYFNAYAEGLRSLGAPLFGHGHLLWIARLILIPTLILHVWAAWELSQRKWQGRTTKYTQHVKVHADYASLTIRWGGVAILLFVIYHVLHLTLGAPRVHPDFVQDDAYHNLVVGLQSYFYIPAIIYLLATVALGLHLYHGTWSMFQTLGLNNKTYNKLIRQLALLLAIVVPVGFAAVPIGVMLGIIHL
jgi:succinate dehydrogenase / fumarate reductase cytochrome b subunit